MKVKKKKKLKGQYLKSIGNYYCKTTKNYIYIYDKNNFIKINKYQMKNPARLAYDEIYNIIYIGTTSGDIYACKVDIHLKMKFEKLMTSDIDSMLLVNGTLICLYERKIIKYDLHTGQGNVIKELNIKDLPAVCHMCVDKDTEKILIFSPIFRIILNYNYEIEKIVRVEGFIKSDGGPEAKFYDSSSKAIYDVELKVCSEELNLFQICLRKTSLENDNIQILLDFDYREFSYRELPKSISLLNEEKWMVIWYRESFDIYEINSLNIIFTYEFDGLAAYPTLEYIKEDHMLIFSTCFEIELIYLE